MKNPEHFPVAVDKACYVGDIVAVVVAESRYAAADAVDAVVVDYEPLPAVVDLEDALSDRVVIHEDARHQQVLHVGADPRPRRRRRRRSPSAAHTVSGALRPAAADPGGHGAPRRGGRAAAPRRRVHASTRPPRSPTSSR